MSKNRGSLRRACTLVTAATLTTGLLTVVAVTPADAAPTAVEVGTVADQLVDSDGTTLWLAGSKGVGYNDAAARHLIDGTLGAHALAQAADGTVYATSEHSLYAIDGSRSVTTISTGGYDCLGDVAATTGAVWVVSACTADDPHLVRIAGTTVTADVITRDEPGSMRLASSAGAPAELVVSDHSTYTYTDDDGVDHQYVTPRFRAFDTSSAAPTVISTRGLPGGTSTPSLELNKDGSRLLAGAGDSYVVLDVASPNKSQEFYRGAWDVTASAFSADGRFVGLAHQSGAANLLDLYTADGTWLRSSAMTAPVVGLAWQGSSLATINRPATGTDQLDMRTSAYRTTPQIESYEQFQRTYWGEKITGGGIVRTEAGDPARSVQVTVTRSGPDGKRTIGTVVTGDNGSFTWKDTPGVAGKFSYTSTVSASEIYMAKSGSTTYYFSHHTSGLKITTDHSRYVVGQNALVTATLPRHYTNRTVAIYAQGGGHSRVLLRKGPVNSSGKISVHIYVPFNTTLTASYGGDARYSAASARVTRYAKARIDTALSKPARKSHGYYVFSAKKGSSFYAWVRPAHKGSIVHFVLQRYRHGHWANYLVGSVKQTKDGAAAIRYAGKSGVKYRERAYVGDSTYARANTSGWRYLTFTR